MDLDLENIIFFDKRENNHYYTFKNEKFTGVIDSFKNIILEAQYFKILYYNLFDKSKKKAEKEILLLETTDRKWIVYYLKKKTFLKNIFDKIKIINNQPYFVDQNKNIFVIDFDNEDFIPATFDIIRYGFTHKYLKHKVDLDFEEYSNKYFENFISKYTTNNYHKQLIKSVCCDSIENPRIVYNHLDLFFDKRRDNDSIILWKYFEQIVFSQPKIDKELKGYLAQAYSLWLQNHLSLNEFEECVSIFNKFRFYEKYAKPITAFESYCFVFNALLELKLEINDEFKNEVEKIYDSLKNNEKKDSFDNLQIIINAM